MLNSPHNRKPALVSPKAGPFSFAEFSSKHYGVVMATLIAAAAPP